MTTLIFLTALAVLYFFLVAPRMLCRPDRTPFLNAHYAHRGLFDNASNAPENSLPAFQKAVNAGYGIELDVHLTKDGIPVVFHDDTLQRMCGIAKNVRDCTLEELRQLTLRDSSAVIPTLAEVLSLVDGRVPLIIEYKLETMSSAVCIQGDALLRHYSGAYCIESYHPLALIWYKRNRPDVLRGQLGLTYWKQARYRRSLPLYLPLSYLLSNFLTRPDFIAFLHTDRNNISFRVAKALGAMTVAFTVRSQMQYDAAKACFDLFIFDSFIPHDH